MRTMSSIVTAVANIRILVTASTRHGRAARPHESQRRVGVRHRIFAVDRVETECAEHALRRRNVFGRRFALPAADHIPPVWKLFDVAMNRGRWPAQTALHARKFVVAELLAQEAVEPAQFAG